MFLRSLTLLAGLTLAAAPLSAQDMTPFGTDEDMAFANTLWQEMVAARMAGPDSVVGFPYPGTDPHGFLLETYYTKVTIGDHTGALIIKRNYGPLDVSEDEVIADPAGHLGAITVMFERAPGYDDETGNWFYAKYLPDGSLDMNPKGMALAGLVGKGADAGCIACHQNAGGDDYIFTTDADLKLN